MMFHINTYHSTIGSLLSIILFASSNDFFNFPSSFIESSFFSFVAKAPKPTAIIQKIYNINKFFIYI